MDVGRHHVLTRRHCTFGKARGTKPLDRPRISPTSPRNRGETSSSRSPNLGNADQFGQTGAENLNGLLACTQFNVNGNRRRTAGPPNEALWDSRRGTDDGSQGPGRTQASPVSRPGARPTEAATFPTTGIPAPTQIGPTGLFIQELGGQGVTGARRQVTTPIIGNGVSRYIRTRGGGGVGGTNSSAGAGEGQPIPNHFLWTDPVIFRARTTPNSSSHARARRFRRLHVPIWYDEFGVESQIDPRPAKQSFYHKRGKKKSSSDPNEARPDF